MSGNKRQFQSIDRIDVPHTRKGKHYDIVEQILQEIGELRAKQALKIPRSSLGAAKLQHVRAALSRASSREKMGLATSSDEKYFYVWREE